MFYNRESELEYLLERYKTLKRANSGELIVLYGRRRVGKTTLAQEFLKRVGGAYLYVDLAEERDIFQGFSRAIREQLGDLVDFQEPERFFDYCRGRAKRGPLVVVLDEFQRFSATATRVITRFQHEWDQTLKDLPIMAVLMGSSIGMMQQVALSATAPLFGRATGIQKLAPFNFRGLRQMFPELAEADKIRLYAVFGGTPYYLNLAKRSQKKDLFGLINDLVLAPGAPLREEPRLLLLMELKEISRYNSILHAIASGKATIKEIGEQAGIEPNKVSYYLRALSDLLDLVTPEAPVLGKKKMGRYRISDPFFRFWYRFVYPNFGALEVGNQATVLEFIKQNLEGFVGWAFEDVARELLVAYNGRELMDMPLNFTQIGRWWNRAAEELDIVAVNEREKTIWLGEVKWTNHPVGKDVIEDLLRRKELIEWRKGRRKEYLLVVSRSGLSDEAQRLSSQVGVTTLTLNEVVKLWDGVQLAHS